MEPALISLLDLPIVHGQAVMVGHPARKGKIAHPRDKIDTCKKIVWFSNKITPVCASEAVELRKCVAVPFKATKLSVSHIWRY